MDGEHGSRPRAAKSRGRPFAKGNVGRKPGSKNRSTLLAEALNDLDATQLARRAFELAIGGNVPMLKFLLERLTPRERLIRLELPRINFADDAVTALSAVLRDVAEGKISPSEGAALATVINSCARAIEMEDAVKTADSLEATSKGRIAQ
jgi:hypothetical protein